MELQVKDPVSGALLIYTAKPERLHDLHGFRIQPPNGSGFFIASRGGAWRMMDGHAIEPDLLVNIGLALEHQPLQEQTGVTDNQPSLNSGLGDEAFTDPNKP